MKEAAEYIPSVTIVTRATEIGVTVVVDASSFPRRAYESLDRARVSDK